jgi:hypothetical protein
MLNNSSDEDISADDLFDSENDENNNDGDKEVDESDDDNYKKSKSFRKIKKSKKRLVFQGFAGLLSIFSYKVFKNCPSWK